MEPVKQSKPKSTETMLTIKSKSKGTTQEVSQTEWDKMTKLGHNVHFQVISKK